MRILPTAIQPVEFSVEFSGRRNCFCKNLQEPKSSSVKSLLRLIHSTELLLGAEFHKYVWNYLREVRSLFCDPWSWRVTFLYCSIWLRSSFSLFLKPHLRLASELVSSDSWGLMSPLYEEKKNKIKMTVKNRIR